MAYGYIRPQPPLPVVWLQGDTGRLHVVDDDGRLLGLVSRTDMLRHFQHYKEMSRRVV
jgi:CBS domain-containing protein